MNCLTKATKRAFDAQYGNIVETPHANAFKRAVRNAEKQKLTSIFERQILEAGFKIKDWKFFDPIAVPSQTFFREFLFWPGRKFPFDYALPGYKLAVEIEGGVWRKGGGAHSHPTNIMRDIEKYNGAVIMGWRILRFTDYHLKTPYAVECVTEAIKGVSHV